MVFGGVSQEQLILYESSMWSGSREDADREDAYQHLLLEGKNKQAEDIFSQHFTCQGAGSGHAHGSKVPFGCYQVLGTLNLSFFQYGPFEPMWEDVTSYSRSLDLDNALAHSEFSRNSRIHSRDVIASAPDEAIIIRLHASQPGSISVLANLQRPENFSVSAYSEDTLLMSGQLPDGAGNGGIHYACFVKAVCRGGVCIHAKISFM
jgi:alpha-L-fucosidase 2